MGGARMVLGNSPVSWLSPTNNLVRFFRLPIDSGSSAETRYSFCQYCALVFDGERKVLGNSLVSWL